MNWLVNTHSNQPWNCWTCFPQTKYLLLNSLAQNVYTISLNNKSEVHKLYPIFNHNGEPDTTTTKRQKQLLTSPHNHKPSTRYNEIHYVPQYSGSWAEVRLILHVMEIFPPRQSKVHATPIECTHEKATKHVTGAANTGMVRGMINQNVELKMTNGRHNP